MPRKLTILVDDEVYQGLHRVIGPRRISRFLNDLARPHVIRRDLNPEYAEMAADETRESEALDWAEGLIGDVADDPRQSSAARRRLVDRFRGLTRRRNQEGPAGCCGEQ